MISLPTEKLKAEQLSPRKLIIYSQPKAGKTTLLSKLDNCLILDFENGASSIDSMRLNIVGLFKPKAETKEVTEARHVKKHYYLDEALEAIKAAGMPYKYGALDTITKIEELCEGYGTWKYMNLPMGKSFNRIEGSATLLPYDKWASVLTLANGAGYLYLREAFKEIITMCEKAFPNVILVGHLKDKTIEKKGVEVKAKDIDLTGKISSITAASADAIGYLYRSEGKGILTFAGAEEIVCGARPEHLRGKEIIISEEIDGKIEVFWDKIYID